MREQLIEGDDSVTIDAPERVSFGQHVRQAGEDIAKGAVALTAGTRLDAASMGLLASLGYAEVDVYLRPKVAIFFYRQRSHATGRAAPQRRDLRHQPLHPDWHA